MGHQEDVAELTERIRRSAETGESVVTDLSTSERIIARVTDGIYREPWAAFRELVANAYDADATRVVVETGAPDFKQVVVRDDGNGMKPETIAYIMRSIGGSSKRTSAGVGLDTVDPARPDFSPGGRPLIGKIGIGLFAVAQLTQHFQIISKARGERTRTSATVLLRTHDEKTLRDLPPDEEYVAGNVTIKTEVVSDEEIDSHGTTVVLYSLRPETRRSLQSVMRWHAAKALGPDGKAVREPPIFHIGVPARTLGRDEPQTPPNLPWATADPEELRFEKLFQAAERGSDRDGKPADLEHFDEYLKLIWQLSLSLPLRYIREHPFDKTGEQSISFLSVSNDQPQAFPIDIGENTTLRQHFGLVAGTLDPLSEFEVVIDGITLRRPIELPDRLRRQSRVKTPVMLVSKVDAAFSNDELERAGGNLSFEAYLYWNSQIVPKDTAGVLVRVRGASGTLFDQSFLRYQVSEQTRLRQITAEIFVNDGLDAAINIDRESFNYSHPHYLYIQRWLHRCLRLLVNRLKAIAAADLEAERSSRLQRAAQNLIEEALLIWEQRCGADSDPPVADLTGTFLPPDVAGVPLDWGFQSSVPKATAIAIILEAYGLLSRTEEHERGNLVRNLIKLAERNS